MYFDIWIIGAVISTLVWLFFDGYNASTTDESYPLNVYVVMYFLIFVFSWFSLSLLLGAMVREYNKNKNEEK